MSSYVGFTYVDTDETWGGFDNALARENTAHKVCAECEHWRYIDDSYINPEGSDDGPVGAQGYCSFSRSREAAYSPCGRCFEARPVPALGHIPCVKVRWPRE
jgi:hypothetical protein